MQPEFLIIQKMNINDSEKIGERWDSKVKENPNIKCPGHRWEKEYFNGTHTGDYVCTICGETSYEHRS